MQMRKFMFQAAAIAPRHVAIGLLCFCGMHTMISQGFQSGKFLLFFINFFYQFIFLFLVMQTTFFLCLFFSSTPIATLPPLEMRDGRFFSCVLVCCIRCFVILNENFFIWGLLAQED